MIQLGLAAALLLAAAGRPSGYVSAILAQRSALPPTFNSDVAPILYRRCVACHRPGEAAPMSLLTFEQVRPWAKAIKAKVVAREMPPWGADAGIGEFRNSRALNATELETLVAWVDSGAPQGEGGAPQPPRFSEGWNASMNRPPDYVLELPVEFETPASGEIPTFTVWSQLPFRDDRLIEALEVRPSNPRVVHHAGVGVADLPANTRIGRGPLWEGGPPSDGVAVLPDGQAFRATSPDAFGYPIAFYVPGGGVLRFPTGVAKRLPARKYLAWGMHFVTTGHAERTHVTMGLWFAKGRVTHEAEMMTVNEKVFVGGKEILPDDRGRLLIPPIPARAANWEIVGTLHFLSDATLYSLWPHMHYRGKDMTFSIAGPDQRESTTLLKVSKYSPLWQMTYELAAPLKIRAGSTIKAVAHYDNSAENRLNPAPDQDVVWGPQSWNEMFHAFIEVAVEPKQPRQ
jgi:hypothetical protein